MLLPSPIMAANPVPKREQQRVEIGLRLGLRALAVAISSSLRPSEKRQANILGGHWIIAVFHSLWIKHYENIYITDGNVAGSCDCHHAGANPELNYNDLCADEQDRRHEG